jgi:16S rRNA (cytosine967-C5)-methyltransferase
MGRWNGMETHEIPNQTSQSPPFPSGRFSPDVIRLTEEAYGLSAAPEVLNDLTKPVRAYYVRCNTIKISPINLMRRLTERGFRISQHPTIPEALGIEIEGPLVISRTEKTITVDKHTAESVLQGANVYAPGVIQCQSIRIGDYVTINSEMGDALANGTARMSANEILTFRKGLAVRVDQRRYSAPQIRELPEHSQGLLYPQSLAAMATSRVLDPQPEEAILDLNCAPGGKLTHISQLMQNSGKIVGLDRNAEKIASTRRTIATLGCYNATVSIHDSRYAHKDFSGLKVDRVLVDPPCSALGLRPKIYDMTTKLRVNNLSQYQKQFLKSASNVVRPGGVVVYSVCTYTVMECESVVEYAEKECGLRLVEQKPYVASTTTRSAKALCQRFSPVEDEIGYFIAKFER